MSKMTKKRIKKHPWAHPFSRREQDLSSKTFSDPTGGDRGVRSSLRPPGRNPFPVWELEKDTTWEPERWLMAYTLFHAIKDVTSTFDPVNADEQARIRIRAYNWIYDNDPGGNSHHLTYVECCEAIGRPPEAIRKLLEAKGITLGRIKEVSPEGLEGILGRFLYGRKG